VSGLFGYYTFHCSFYLCSMQLALIWVTIRATDKMYTKQIMEIFEIIIDLLKIKIYILKYFSTQ